MNIHPAFGIQIQDKEYWGMAFEQGSIVAPSDYKAEKYLNFSLANKWTWPLSWGSYTRAETLEALCNDAKAQLPDVIRSLFKKRKKVKGRLKKSVPWPPEKNKDYYELYDLLMHLPADDLNNRAQTAVRVLSTLNRSRGIKY